MTLIITLYTNVNTSTDSKSPKEGQNSFISYFRFYFQYNSPQGWDILVIAVFTLLPSFLLILCMKFSAQNLSHGMQKTNKMTNNWCWCKFSEANWPKLYSEMKLMRMNEKTEYDIH